MATSCGTCYVVKNVNLPVIKLQKMWTMDGRVVYTLSHLRTTMTSLSVSKDINAIICASIPGFLFERVKNTEVARAATSGLSCYTR